MSPASTSSTSSTDTTRPSLVAYLHRAFRAAGVLLGVVVVLNGAVFGYLLWSLGPDLESTIDSGRTVRVMHEAMLNQETGLRGFLLTGDPTSLEPYEEGQVALQAATDEAEAQLADDPRFARDFLAMRLAQQRWIDEWAVPASRGPTLATDDDRAAFIGQGQEYFDAYRVIEERLIDNLVSERSRLLARQRAVLGVTGVAALVAGLALFAVAIRERRRLQSLVVRPVQDLHDAMERLRDGDLTARATGGGTAEFDDLADSLDSMATELADAHAAQQQHAAALAARSQRQARILAMARDIAGSLNLRYVLRAVADHAHALAAAAATTVWLVEDEDTALVEAWHQDSEGGGPGIETIDLGQGLVGEVARDGRAKAADAKGEPTVSVGFDDVATALALPMIVGARVVGVIEVRFDQACTVDSELVVMLETLCSHGGTAIEAARLHETTTELSQIDALTRLFNRRRLDADLDAEVARASRYGRPLAFMMGDVDHFKKFNDTFGHQRGDEVLQEVARLLSQNVRAADTVYRYGGEELSVLLRETDAAAARHLAERLRATIEHHFGSRVGPGGVTMSFGVAAVGDAVTTREELVRAADEALYQAKATGRNLVVTAT